MPEPLKNRVGDQPLPTGGTDAVQAKLINIIGARRLIGIERYNSPVMTWNGRSALTDAFEEALDLTTYLLQVITEVDDLQNLLVRMLYLADELETGGDPGRFAAARIRGFVAELRDPADIAPKTPEPPSDFVKALIEQHRPVVRTSPMTYGGMRDVQCKACDGNRWQMIRLLDAIPECALWTQSKALGLVEDATPTDAGE